MEINKEKRFKMELELYARGKRRTASVTGTFGDPKGPEDDGVIEDEAFATFWKAAHVYCQHLIDIGEL